MQPKKLPPEKIEALRRKLQGSLEQRRPSSWRIVLGTLLACVILLGLLAWWLYPRPEPPRLEVVAVDALFPEDDTPQARAYLAVPEDLTEYDTSVLEGRDLIFTDPPIVTRPGEQARTEKTTTDAEGQATAAWPTQGKAAPFTARYVNVERRTGADDQATLFPAVKGKRLIVVDVEVTLAATPPESWPTQHPIAIAARPGAAAVLSKAGQDSQVIYLSVHPALPIGYRRARGWIALKRGQLPDGPVLGRVSYAGEQSVDDVRRELLRELQTRYSGAHVAVVGTPGAAAVARGLGLDTILIGEGPAADGVTVVADWNAAAAHLVR